MGISLRHAIFVMASLVSLVWTSTLLLQWMGDGGNVLNLPSFFIDAYNSGSAAAFLTIDILFVWGVFIIWVIGDAQRVGLGAKWGWGFAALSFAGTCVAFPLYLVFRERKLDAAG